jgi:hypothetical protein
VDDIQEAGYELMGTDEVKLPRALNRPELWNKNIEEQAKILQAYFPGR